LTSFIEGSVRPNDHGLLSRNDDLVPEKEAHERRDNHSIPVKFRVIGLKSLSFSANLISQHIGAPIVYVAP